MILSETQKTEKLLTSGLTLLLAIAGGISVANIYYHQPLLNEIAVTFQTTSSSVGLISTFTQLGYALGIFLFVPLGDIKDKKKLILILAILVTFSLLGVASAQNLIWIYIASFAVGITSVIPQIITPLAAQLAAAEERGKALGTVVSGLLLGILLARTVAGYIGYIAGWRFMFVFAAFIMLGLASILYFKLPSTEVTENLTYKELLKSVSTIVRKYPMLRKVSVTGGLLFGAFSVFWTTMVFLLESSPYHFESYQIGLFGLLGVSGALGASLIGRLTDKKNPKTVVTGCTGIAIVAYLILSLFGMQIWGIIIGVILLDLGIQGAQISNSTIIYSINNDERSRLNCVFVVSNFIGAAVGSCLGALAWNLYHWEGVCTVGLAMLVIAFGISMKKMT